MSLSNYLLAETQGFAEKVWNPVLKCWELGGILTCF